MIRIVIERVITVLRISIAIQTLSVFVSGSVNCKVMKLKFLGKHRSAFHTHFMVLQTITKQSNFIFYSNLLSPLIIFWLVAFT
jgi:hypothetical protein